MSASSTALFIEPLDVLILRGNKLFADAGSHGEALMPPWPSVAAGALRSRMLVDAGIHPADFASGQAALPGNLARSLGTVAQPGSFRLAHFGLARRHADTVEPLFPLPADIVVDTTDGKQRARALIPRAVHPCLRSSAPLPLSPVLAQPSPAKPQTGLWLTLAGFSAWQAGTPLEPKHWLDTHDLWARDDRLGIALEPGRNTAAEGQLYTSEAIALKHGVGFFAQVSGAMGELPSDGLLRFGGDGRGARVSICAVGLPTPDLHALAAAGRFRLLLTSPGIFAEGWTLPGTQADGRWHFRGASARIACAAVPRLETISGWDVARKQPKPAARAVPTGSVYWLDEFQGDAGALSDLMAHGLTDSDPHRSAEGFNNCTLAAWA